MSIKDKITSKLLKVYINKKLKKAGEMLEFKLDSKNKSIAMKIKLLGEDKDLEVNINKYDINEINDKFFIKISEINTNKEWINILSKELLKEKDFEISNEIYNLLKIVA